MTQNQDVLGQPALLVGAARSGTTLLRLVLNAHGDVACPSEAGVPSLLQHARRVWWTICSDHDGRELESLPDGVDDEIRRAVHAPMAYYCRVQGKRIYCDKSLDSVHALEQFHKIFPETRYILLFRHVMDTVASGIEASPWGFNAFGYLPFVQSSADNFVAALVNYWQAHVAQALRWQEAHSDACHRVRYEDLVAAPEATLASVFEFLGVEPDLTTLERAFAGPAGVTGPGDYKVVHTTGVHAASVGHGKRVPVNMIPPPLLELTNDKLQRLGYDALDRSWNSEPRATAASQSDEACAADLERLMSAAIGSRGAAARDAGTFALVSESRADLRWIIDAETGAIRHGDGDVGSVITGTTEDLVAMIKGDVNVGVLLRAGRIRHLTARGDLSYAEMTEDVSALLTCLRQ